VKAGIAQAREQGRSHGRPASAAAKAAEVKRLFKQELNKSEIARKVGIGRTSVVRVLYNSEITQRLKSVPRTGVGLVWVGEINHA
jgi:DNA invertase Pin-like site-specific DNA recombinase